MKVDPNTSNPFASPHYVGESVTVELGSYEIQGERIVGTDKIILPHACVKCGDVLHEEDSSIRLKKDLDWVHPAIYFLLIQVLIFLIVYFVTRRRCRVEYSLCRDCIGKQRMNDVYTWASLAVFLGMIALAITLENAWLTVGVIVAFAMILTFAIRANGPLSVKAYKNGEFQLRGAGPAFLQYAESYTDAQVIPAVVVAEDGRLV